MSVMNYVLGHELEELDRLVRQSRLFNPLTRETLENAGLRSGMRVLDIGCGVGDVSFLASDLVGESGSVFGIDRSPEAVRMARRRALEQDRRNVHFDVAEADDVAPPHQFDAAIGRFVLMYQSDPVATLRRVAGYVRPGGIIALHELDLARGFDSMPECALWDQTALWVREVMRKSGVQLRAGLCLPAWYRSAGLTFGGIRIDSLATQGPDSDAYYILAATAQSLSPAAEALGMAGEREDALELAERIREEVLSQRAIVTTPQVVGAWARAA